MKLPWERKRETDDSALDDEIRGHFAMAVADRIARGESPDHALAAARREFGNVGHVKEVTREMWGGIWLERLLQDIRYAVRSLKRTPSFSIVAILTIALGIGVNAAMFTVVNGVLLKPLPFREPDRLFMLSHAPANSPFVFGPAMPDREYIEFRDKTRAFESTASFHTFEASLVGAGEPMRVVGAGVTPSFLHVLGVRPQLGRGFAANEDTPGNNAVAMIGASLWRTRFAGDTSVIGRSVTIDGDRHTIVGVLPDGFDYPSRAQVYLPLRVAIEPHRSTLFPVVGRLAPNGSRAQALAELHAVIEDEARNSPAGRSEHFATEILSLRDAVIGDVRRALLVFSAAVVFVLLIACANVSNLMTMRTASRGQEFGVRAALGAPAGRLVRQLLTESTTIAVLGGIVGLGLGALCLRAALLLAPAGMVPRMNEIHLDWRVLLATMVACFLAALVFGLLPALHVARRDLREMFGSASRVTGRSSLRNLIVVVETALALVLLVGAGLLVRSYVRMMTVDLGFKPNDLVAVTLDLPERRYQTAEHMHAFQRDLSERIAHIPGVSGNAAVNWRPISDALTMGDFTLADGRTLPPNYMVAKPCITPGYFAVMGMPVRQGRGFVETDDASAPRVVVISASVAKQFWPNGDAIGKRISMEDKPSANGWMTIVGVVDDVHQQGVRNEPMAAIYLPLAQTTMTGWLGHLSFVARANGDVSGVATAMRAAVRAIDPEQPVESVQTMTGIIASSIAEPRFQTAVLALFSALALLLAAVGIYGVLSYSVGERTREIGVRIALGAAPESVVAMVLRRTLALVVPGVIIGLGVALGLTRALSRFLFEIKPTDPATLVAVSVLLAIVALAAAWSPARRASRVDPMLTLRVE